jgi:hypothetical protein
MDGNSEQFHVRMAQSTVSKCVMRNCFMQCGYVGGAKAHRRAPPAFLQRLRKVLKETRLCRLPGVSHSGPQGRCVMSNCCRRRLCVDYAAAGFPDMPAFRHH